jgi:hypothetical protein
MFIYEQAIWQAEKEGQCSRWKNSRDEGELNIYARFGMSAAVLLKIHNFCLIYSASSDKQLPTFRRIVLLTSLGPSIPRTNRGAREGQDILCRQ